MARLFKTRRKIRILPLLCVFGLAAGFQWYTEEWEIRETLAFAGIPQAQTLGPLSLIRILRNHGFLVGYSELHGNPLWVSYRLRPVEKNHAGPRPKQFSTDYRTLRRIASQDYSGSGYDRGHLAPNYAIANLYGPKAQRDAFLMSNITPQKSRLNQKLWQRLEEVEIDYFTRRFGELWVFTGPLFDTVTTRLPSGVEIPDSFYKIFVVPADPPRLLAFIVPQAVQGLEPLDRFLASVDEIERRSGLDFLHQLNDTLEAQLESGIDTAGWHLEEAARLPPRY